MYRGMSIPGYLVRRYWIASMMRVAGSLWKSRWCAYSFLRIFLILSISALSTPSARGFAVFAPRFVGSRTGFGAWPGTPMVS